jgi:hypothetical protein
VTRPHPNTLALHSSTEERKQENLKAWAIVELFGHQRIVGMVTVDPVDFPGMVRVDVPDLLKNGEVERPGFTRYFGRSALYAVTPISEQSVRELLPHVNGYPARPLSIGPNDW